MKYVFTFLACLCFAGLFAQQHHGHVYDQVMEQQELFRSSVPLNLFGESAESARRNSELSDVIRDGTIMQLDVDAMFATRRAEHSSLHLTIPRSNGKDFEIELIESNVLADDFTLFTSSDPDVPADYTPGKHYKGIVSGDRHSVVALSMFDHELVGLINTNEGNFVLAKLENSRDRYVLYNDHSLVPTQDWGCEMADDDVVYTPEQLNGSSTRDAGDCVRIYVEVHEDITNGRGSVAAATNYVTAVMNQSAILFANDGITITVSEMKVWNTTSPYTSTNAGTLLNQFQANLGSFNGDLGHLIGYAGNGGIAAGFSGICNSNPDNSMCYSGIDATYNDVPTYSWTVSVVTHEMGHLFGSRHTHACVWNGNNTAIDGCYATEGSCPRPGNPSGGGTIMSYCHLNSTGINMNNGFGPQPAALINNNVNNASCLSPCGSADCAAPTGLSTSVITETSATLTWSAVSTADNYTVEWRAAGASSWNTASAAGTSYSVSGLTLATDYQWRVRANCGGASGSYSSISSFTTGGTPPPEYCATTGNNISDEWIALVSVANLTNTTGENGGYADFTAQSADLSTGTSYTANLTPGYSGTNYNEFWTIWIDYNGDFDFDDAGELVAQANGNSAVTASFTVPASVGVTSTRMRVSMKYNAYSTPCETFTWGEVEDYTVNFGTAPPPSCNAPSNLSSSAVAQTTATVSWNAVTNAVNYTIQLRVQGGTWGAESAINSAGANVTGLSPATTYEWRVKTNCSGGSSSYSSIASFTTDQATGGCTYQPINSNNFESGWGIWNDGGSDCRRSSQDANYALGTYCVRLRDNTSTSTMTTDNLNLSTYGELTVDFSYYPRSMDNSNEDFWLQVSTNGGSSYQTVAEWNRGDEFQNNQRYSASVVITGTFSSSTRLRFRCDASGNQDWVYIDEVNISGCNNAAIYNPTFTDFAPVDQDVLSMEIEDEAELIESFEDIRVYPNPVKDELNIEFNIEQSQNVSLYMTSVDGKVQQQLTQFVEQGMNDLTIDVRNMASGLYAMTIVTLDGVKTKMVIVQ